MCTRRNGFHSNICNNYTYVNFLAFQWCGSLWMHWLTKPNISPQSFLYSLTVWLALRLQGIEQKCENEKKKKKKHQILNWNKDEQINLFLIYNLFDLKRMRLQANSFQHIYWTLKLRASQFFLDSPEKTPLW